MVIGRNPQRDHRRRRALVDESRSKAIDNVNRGCERPIRRYTPAVARGAQLRLVDMIPSRHWTLLVWHLVLATILVAHAAFATWELQVRQSGWKIDLSAFNLNNPHSLANWTAAISLLIAAVYSILILTFRRHKIDDYRGRYRVWYPIILALIVTASCTGSGLTHTGKASAVTLLNMAGIPANSPWLLGCLWLGASVAWVRILLELLPSRAAVASLLFTGICFACAGLLDLNSVASMAEVTGLWGRPLALLAGTLGILLTTVNFARFVYLDTQGKLNRTSTASDLKASSTSALERTAAEITTEAEAESVESDADQASVSKPSRLSRLLAWRSKRIGESSATAAEDAGQKSEEPQPTTKSAPRKSRKLRQKSSPQPTVANSEKTDGSGGTEPALARRLKKRPEVQTQPEVEAETDDRAESRMSRSERRRIRKEKKRQKRAA